MLFKLLLVIGVIAVVYFFFIKKSMPLTKERKSAKKNIPKDDETMVECVQCGTYITTGEALTSNAKFYCTTECRDKA